MPGNAEPRGGTFAGSTYWTAFHVADRVSHGRTQAERHRALIEGVSQVACSAVWTETPHFVIFDSRVSIDDIKDRLKSAIDEEIDLFVLASAASMAGRIVGAPQDRDIFKLMSAMEQG